MKPRTLLVYLAVLAALAAFYYAFEVRLGGQAPEEAEQARLFDLAFDQVDEVRYQRQGVLFHFQEAGPDAWAMLSPMKTAADRWALDMMIRLALSGRSQRRFDPGGADLSEYGLKPPRISLTLMGDGEKLAPALFIGRENPTGQFFYAAREGSDRVMTIPAALAGDLDKNLFQLRDKALMLSPGEDVRRLTVEAGGEKTVLVKKGLRHWEAVEPEETRADNDLVQEMIYKGLKGRVKQFVEPDQAAELDMGLDEPRVRIIAGIKDGGEVEVVVGRALTSDDQQPGPLSQKRYYAQASDRDQPVVVDQALADRLAQGFKDLKDRHVLPLDRRRVWGLELQYHDRKLVAEKEDLNWTSPTHEDTESLTLALDEFVLDLEDLKYQRGLESEDDEALKKADVAVVVKGPGDKVRTLRVDLNGPREGLAVAQVDDGPKVLLDKDEFLHILPEMIRPGHDRAASETASPSKEGD